jgi:hypothetical protein
MPDKYLTRAEAAEYLRSLGAHYTPDTLKVYACRGRGPAYRRIGHRAMYSIRDLESFVKAATGSYVVTPAQLKRTRWRAPPNERAAAS